MHKSLIALVGAAGIGLAALAAPAPANAGCYGCAVGAGILGGLAAGAIIGSAIANSPPPGYYPPPPGLIIRRLRTIMVRRRLPALMVRRRLRVLMVRRLPALTRRLLTLSWRRVVTGDNDGSGSKVWVIGRGRFQICP